MHVPNLGQSMLMIDAFWKPKEVILRPSRRPPRRPPGGKVDPGPGLDEHRLGRRLLPHKEELDAVAPNNPVSLQRADAHMFWFNSMALDMAGITRTPPIPRAERS